MANLQQTISVTIFRRTGGVAVPSFDTPMFVGKSQRTTLKVALFADFTAVGQVYLPTDPESIAANTYFAQSPKGDKFIIGVREADAVLSFTVVDNFQYDVKINDELASFTSDASATPTEVSAGVFAAINALVGAGAVVTAVDDDPDVTVSHDVSDSVFDLEIVSDNITVVFNATDTIATVLPILQVQNDDWSMLAMHSRIAADITAAATFIEANTRKMFGWQSSDADLLTTATTDIGSTLKAANFDRSFGIYNSVDTAFSEVAMMGSILPKDTGSVTAKFQTLSTIIAELPSVLTATAQTNLDNKNVNYYIDIGPLPLTQEGKTSGGEFIDIIRDLDFLEANLQIDILRLFATQDKVPFTDEGGGQIEGVMKPRLDNGITRGIIADDGSLFLTIPKVATLLAADKANRDFKDIKFGFNVAGAIHFVTVEGEASVG